VSSSENDFHHVPRSRDGAPNWAADTDPVGPVTPELALVDPALASGDFNSEVTMSSTQFGDGTTFGAPEGSAAPADPQPLAPLQPIPPLNQPAPASDVAAPVPTEPAPSVPVTDMRDVPLGTLVFRAGLLPEERLEEALQEGMKTGRRLGEILLERGWVSENDLGQLLAAQKGLPFVELDPAGIDPSAPPLLHPEKARLHGALPIGFQDGVPVVAVADPSNDLVVENVRRALACEPRLVVAGRDALGRAIEQVYGGTAEPASVPEAAVETPAAPQVVEAAAQVVEPAVPAAEPTPAVAADCAARRGARGPAGRAGRAAGRGAAHAGGSRARSAGCRAGCDPACPERPRLLAGRDRPAGDTARRAGRTAGADRARGGA
jgi:Type II secretion system (T2SS), protein E, N-terminal domain